MKKGIKLFVLLILLATNLSAQPIVQIDQGTYQFISNEPDYDLHFYLFDDGYHSFESNPIHQYENYSITAKPLLYHAKPYDDQDPLKINLGNIVEGVPISLQQTQTFQNKIEIKTSWNLVDLKNDYFILMFENSESNQPISGCVEFHYRTNELEIDENNILDDYGNHWVNNFQIGPSEYEDFIKKFQWSFDNLEFGEQRFIYIPAICLSESMSNVISRGVMKVDNCEKVIPYNSKIDGSIQGVYNSQIYTLNLIVSNHPHDPNYISSDPNCLNSEFFVQTIKYHLHFQNEGIDPSEDVQISIISTEDFEGVLLIDASNNCYLNWDSESISVDFDDMFIQGLNQTPPPEYEETTGWIEFEICYNVEDLVLNNTNCIELNVQIYFDGQPPVEVLDEICIEEYCIHNPNVIYYQCNYTDPNQGVFHDNSGSKVSIEEPVTNLSGISIHPNLTLNNLIIDYSFNQSSHNIEIYTSSGELVKCEKIKKIVDVSQLNQGLYFIRIVDEQNKTEIKSKFVKM